MKDKELEVSSRNNQNTLLFDNDIEYVTDLENDQGHVFRININEGVCGHLRSSLENIYNTIKNRPDIELKHHVDHAYSRCPPFENKPFSFKEEVKLSLDKIREFDDVLIYKSLEQYKKEDPIKFDAHYQLVSEIAKANNEKVVTSNER